MEKAVRWNPPGLELCWDVQQKDKEARECKKIDKKVINGPYSLRGIEMEVKKGAN